MKKLLIGVLVISSVSAFAGEKRIECMSSDKKIHVALVSPSSTFDQIETLTIINSTILGKDVQVQNPNCMIIPRESAKGPFVIVNCEEEKLIVNQFLTKGGDGEATLKSGLKRHSLNCRSN